MKGFWSFFLLIVSNTFMTFACYGHLKFKDMKFFDSLPIFTIILLIWGIALFEYIFRVPANRLGLKITGDHIN